MFGSPLAREKPFLQKLRAQDEQKNLYNDYLKRHNQETLLASWVNKNEKILEKKTTKERTRQMFEEKDGLLERRKQELQEIAMAEHEAYKKEMKNKLSMMSPSERKQAIVTRLKELQDKKEERRKDYVEKQYERAFRRNNDDVRKFYHDLNENIKIHDNQLQMAERQAKMIEEYES